MGDLRQPDAYRSRRNDHRAGTALKRKLKTVAGASANTNAVGHQFPCTRLRVSGLAVQRQRAKLLRGSDPGLLVIGRIRTIDRVEAGALAGRQYRSIVAGGDVSAARKRHCAARREALNLESVRIGIRCESRFDRRCQQSTDDTFRILSVAACWCEAPHRLE